MIATGKNPMSVMTFCAIMSLSLIVNLPGLAITPMLGTLHTIFPGTTQTEDQLLTVLPNLLIIPFVLLSGKLSLARHKKRIIVIALVIFCLCAVAYMFADTMAELIVISCLIGCGTGLIIPFSTGLIADTFSGEYRLRAMGIQSGIANTVVMLATFTVSWLCGARNWHMPFAVYLIGLIPLALCFRLGNLSQPATAVASAGSNHAGSAGDHAATPGKSAAAADGPAVKDGFYVGRIVALTAVYLFITFATICISYYCPFLVEKEGWSETLTGTVTALYFLFIFMPGYVLPWFVKYLKGNCFIIASVCMTAGIGLMAFVPDAWALCIGASLAGLGYGICQPLIYDKAGDAVVSTDKATLSMAFVLSVNYVAIVIAPFVIDLMRDIFHAGHVRGFAFMVCFVLLVLFTVITVLKRDSFVFRVTEKE